MERAVISTTNAPGAIGPYNQAIKANGNFIFTAGQISLDPKTGEVVGDTVQKQTHQTLKNIQAILSEAGCDLSSVVKTTIYLHSMNDFASMNEVYAQYFVENQPARATVGGVDLPKGVMIEMDCVAVY